MKVVHERGNLSIEGEAKGLGGGTLLLTDKDGSFFSIAPEQFSKFNGFWTHDECHIKNVERLTIKAGGIVLVRRTEQEAVREHANGAVEKFTLHEGTLHYAVEKYTGNLEIELDIRRLDDESAVGRSYAVEQRDEAVIVTYDKFTDETRNEHAYRCILAITGISRGAFTPDGGWQERHYQYDERRGDSCRLWTYRLGSVSVAEKAELRFAVAATVDGALAAARREPAKEARTQSAAAASIEEVTAFAALESLLVTPGQPLGIYAGLPWFCRYWSRDELVSTGALIKARKYAEAKAIILRYAASVGEDGLDAYWPKGGLRAADGIGWLAFRSQELVETLDRKKLLWNYFSRRELAALRDALEAAAERAERQRGGGLVKNGWCETWMDTAPDGDGRAGFRIEIQALHLATLAACDTLERKTRLLPVKRWRAKKCAFHDTVRRELLTGDQLLDGVDDRTVRPNLFLAYYLAPDLLSGREWRLVFDETLTRLWLPWGGLATIDKLDGRFVGRYSGRNNKSYHRGDSWYWINNLAALCLRRFDPARYHDKIAEMRRAAVEEMFFHGVVGHCSEVSSADEQEWGGCFAQAWSAAMLYELIKE